MQNSFIHNLIYKFHRLGFCFYSVKYYFLDHYKDENIVKCLFKSIFRSFKLFNYKYGYYEYLEIPITTRCSLKCKNCSNMIPCYVKPKDYDIQILLRSIKNFLKIINNIVYIRVLGGEPFLSKNLYQVLLILLKSDKVQRIEIVTNGTIVPKNSKVIHILKSSRIIVCISQYPVVDSSILVQFLKDNDIHYRIDKMSYWIDYGNVNKRNKTNKELRKQFLKCNHICKSLVNGQIHICPRSSHGTDLGIIKNNQDDYLDLLDRNMSIEDKKFGLRKLFYKKYIQACDYCNYGTKMGKKIAVAEQIKSK